MTKKLVILMALACLLFLVTAGSAVTVNVTPSKIDPNGTIIVNVTDLGDGVNLSLRVQSIFDVPTGASFDFTLENVALPICLSGGNITIGMQNTVNNTIIVVQNGTEVNVTGDSVNGVFSRTVPFDGCPNGTFDLIRVGGTAQSFRKSIISTTTIEGQKTGAANFTIPLTVSGVDAAQVRITLIADGDIAFDGMVVVDSPALSTGAVFVSSLPAGAEVYIDGLFYGETPKLVSGLPVGVRKLQLVMPAFRTFGTNVEVTAGFTQSVYAVLQSTNTSTFVTLPIGGAFGEQITPFVPPDAWEVPGFTNGFFTFPMGFITL
jgi:hypothetical protein